MPTNNLMPQNASPFDSIVRNDGGKEYWLARELMPLLGYSRWSDFVDAVHRGKAACENAQNSATEHFSGLLLKTKGRPQQDYRLSRYACYLVAMNGDPRKTKIAQAQTYFAIKTREAETQQEAQPLPRQLPPVRGTIEYMEILERWSLDSDLLIRSLISQRLAEELG